MTYFCFLLELLSIALRPYNQMWILAWRNLWKSIGNCNLCSLNLIVGILFHSNPYSLSCICVSIHNCPPRSDSVGPASGPTAGCVIQPLVLLLRWVLALLFLITSVLLFLVTSFIAFQLQDEQQTHRQMTYCIPEQCGIYVLTSIKYLLYIFFGGI